MKKGFTLAEVLVTLGIIGVVAALTIPTLVQNHKKHVYVNQLKKTYSAVSQGLAKALVDNNASTLVETRLFNNGSAIPFFQQYFKTALICNKGNLSACIDEHGYMSIDGNENHPILRGGYTDCAVLSDGAIVCILADFINSNIENLFIDINGKKKPNVAGRDYFALMIKNDGTIDTVIDGDGHGHYDFSNIDEYNAFSKIMYDGWQMKY